MIISKKDIKEILEKYTLGDLISKKIIKGGLANQNYKITTTKGTYLFRYCKEKDFDEINHEMKILEILKKNNFTCAYPIKRKDNNYISNSKKLRNVTIYEFIEGSMPKINKKSVTLAANSLAKLHSIKVDKNLRNDNAINIDTCKKLIPKLKKSKKQYPEIFNFFIKETEYHSKNLNTNLSKGLVHSDLFPINTILSKNKLYFIDFEEICYDNVMFDIGVAINGFCYRGVKPNLDLIKLFIKEYERHKKLTKSDKDSLKDYMRFGGLAMVCWNLGHLIKNNNDFEKEKWVKRHIEKIENIKEIDI